MRVIRTLKVQVGIGIMLKVASPIGIVVIRDIDGLGCRDNHTRAPPGNDKTFDEVLDGL